jgi:small-conductance mechanosensitive channel
MTTSTESGAAPGPAWYSLRGKNFLADFLNLLHPPYTLWHLSYVLLGIALAPVIYEWRSVAVMLAFFLGLGIGAHALDETMGNPLQTKLSKTKLYLIGFSTLAAAVGIGLYYALTLSLLLLPLILVESFFAVSYNLEIFRKRFHTMLVFALSWGALPLITGYFVNALSLTPTIILVSAAAGLLTYVQRVLSTPARFVRRKLWQSATKNDQQKTAPQFDGSAELVSVSEKALKGLTLMIFLLALALLLQRLLP